MRWCLPWWVLTEKFEKDNLDGKLAHNKAWEELASWYQEENGDMEKIHDLNRELIGFVIDDNIAKSYDVLEKRWNEGYC